METVKEFLRTNGVKEVKTHIITNGVDEGPRRFSSQELLKRYGDCECETITYEKDFGFDEEDNPIIALISYLAVYVKNQEQS